MTTWSGRALCLVVIAAGGILLLRSQGVRNEPVRRSVASTPDWNDVACYRLGPGENLRHVPDPTPEARRAAAASMNPRGYPVLSLGLRSDHDQLRATWILFGEREEHSPTLLVVLTGPLGFCGDELEEYESLQSIKLRGDWVRRDGATRRDVLDDLGRILALGGYGGVRFTSRLLPRAEYEVRGAAREPDRALSIFNVPTGAHDFEVRGTLAQFVLALSRALQRTIVLDPAASPGPPVRWVDRSATYIDAGLAVSDESVERVLSNVRRELGVEIAVTWVEREVWRLERTP